MGSLGGLWQPGYVSINPHILTKVHTCMHAYIHARKNCVHVHIDTYIYIHACIVCFHIYNDTYMDSYMHLSADLSAYTAMRAFHTIQRFKLTPKTNLQLWVVFIKIIIFQLRLCKFLLLYKVCWNELQVRTINLSKPFVKVSFGKKPTHSHFFIKDGAAINRSSMALDSMGQLFCEEYRFFLQTIDMQSYTT